MRLDPASYRVAFDAVPAPCLLLDPHLTVIDANQAYLSTLGRTIEELAGRPVFDAFAGEQNPETTSALVASMRTVVATARPDRLPLIKYDIEISEGSGQFQDRWWSVLNIPVLDADGRVSAIMNTVEDMTAVVGYRASRDEATATAESLRRHAQGLEVDLEERSRALSQLAVAELSASRRLAGLVEVGLRLASAQTVEDLTQVVIGTGLAALGADGGAIGVRDDERGVLRVALTESLGAVMQQQYNEVPLTSSLPGVVAARTGERILLGDREVGLAFSAEMMEVYDVIGHEAWASFPLQFGDMLLGSLSVAWNQPRDFSPDDVQLIGALAAQCAQALDRLLAHHVEREAAEAVARLSETLQRSLLTEPIQPDHLQLVVRYQPAGEQAQVGGDWYDAFITRDGQTSLVIGDVSGHDRDAAATMAQMRNVLRGVAHALVEPPAAVLSSLDLAMHNLDIDGPATALLARVEQSDADVATGMRTLRWSNAGHPPPLLIRTDGTAVFLERPTDLLLGVDPDTDRHDHTEALAPEETVLFYTDGLVERRGADIETGMAWLHDTAAALSTRPLDELCDALLADIPADVEDDIALLALRAYPENKARPAEAGPEVLPDDLVVDQD